MSSSELTPHHSDNRSPLADPWHRLRALTAARIALGRSGGSLPTHELLDFGLSHARARDAVHAEFDVEKLARELASRGIEYRILSSGVHDRLEYLRRPDLGRRLSDESRSQLVQLLQEHVEPHGGKSSGKCYDLSIIVTDGLSATAVHQQVVPLLDALIPRLAKDGWRLSPLILLRFGRVAIQDEIGQLLQSRIALMLIGERPGLGSPNSLGAYFVHGPRIGLTDADRNCVSNIRPEGLAPEQAAATLHYLLTSSRAKKISGVALKDDREVLNVERRKAIESDRAPSDGKSQ